jgi:hypothetical protein
MALSSLSRPAGMLSVTAAVLIVLSQVMRLGVGRLLGQNLVTTSAYTVTSSIALLLMGPCCSHRPSSGQSALCALRLPARLAP